MHVTVRATKPAPRAASWIPEIQGLRAVALLLIVVFHLWVGRVSGGVDVFFLVSSYLLTRQFVRRYETGSILAPLQTTIRRFARLLPLAAATICLTLIAAWFLLARNHWSAAHWDGFASLFYVENWRLQALSADYYAGNHAQQSLFQHFWSLSMQGQIFILWPVIHWATAKLTRPNSDRIRRNLFTVFTLIFAASLTWSVIFTAQHQQLAYFDTAARLWEFAAGSMLALVHPKLAGMPQALRAGCGWLGFALLISCGFVLPVNSTFPGVAALWPIAAGALIIASSGAPTRTGADRILASNALARVAGYTYALYLTHWPVLVLYLKLTGTSHANALDGAIICAISAAISIALTHLVERPTGKLLHNIAAPTSPRPVAAAALVAALFVSAAGALIVSAESQRSVQEQLARAQAEAALDGTAVPTQEIDLSPGWDPIELDYGAEAIDAPSIDDPLPGADAIENQYVNEGDDCTDYIVSAQTDGICYETAPPTTKNPRVLFVGNSHTQQFSAIGYATRDIVGDFEVRLQAGPGCPFYAGDDAIDDACGATWRAAAEYVTETKPEFVVVLGTQSQFDDADAEMDGVPGWIEKLHKASPDTEFIVMRDSPRLAPAPYECGVSFGWDAADCQHPAPEGPSTQFIRQIERAGGHWVDLTDFICPDGICRPQVGQIAVWFDENHISDAFSRTLAQRFADAVRDEVTQWPAEVYVHNANDRTPTPTPTGNPTGTPTPTETHRANKPGPAKPSATKPGATRD
ncbi:acyltransferase family protein [Gulosibacter bifidus]|uniref:Acyltransferase family protein n=1 Tax=Gulosibacter bifidus TaxID=272239 RepID=A0ABW5RHK6_9MICO|nr:acyltransferase family protein [Gulosibacter bifidus]